MGAFERTLSPQNFKKEFHVETIEVIRNPNTGSIFFRAVEDSNVGGPVATGYKDDPVFSLMVDDTTGEVTWLLHKRGSGGKNNVLDTL